MSISRLRPLAILDAPSNLGLSPPAEGCAPGVYKLPWALRECGIVQALSAADVGTVIPPRYAAAWQPGEGSRNADAIAEYSRKLAARVGTLLQDGWFPMVLGGDCSILLGTALAMRAEGPFGLAFIDAHSDFRHPKNSVSIRAAAGEDLAICTGRGDPRLVGLARALPLVAEKDIVLVGTREHDKYLGELAGLGAGVVTSAELQRLGAGDAAARVLSMLRRGAGDGRFWIHLDLDVVDSAEMWAVDSPEPGGPPLDLVLALAGALAGDERCRGMHLTIYDPDLDPALEIAERIVAGLAGAFEAARACHALSSGA